MKPSVVVALLIGAGIGFGLGMVVRSPSSPGGATPSVAGTPSAAAPTNEDALAFKSHQMPAGILDGLTPAQKAAAMSAANSTTCSQCPQDTVAKCLSGHATCEGGQAQLRRMAELAKQDKGAREITAALGGNAAAPAAPAAQYRKIEVPDDSPSFGPRNAKVTIVEFSDFYCPFCARVLPTLEEIKKNYGNDVRVVFRHQLRGSPPDQKLAAEATMAAHAQGKFWEYHDKVFGNMSARDRPALEKFAEELKLDMGKFRADLDSNRFRAKVQADSEAGSAAGANGTPTFFINGRQFVGAQPFGSFKPVIDEELARANKLLSEGVKAEQLYERLMATAPSAPAPQAPQAAPAAVVRKVDVPADSPSFGPKDAKVTVVEFSDFYCPFCARVLPTLEEMKKTYGKDIRVVFRHQLRGSPPEQKQAAEASMAANEQGKFWEYHDKLFQNMGARDRASLERFAEELKLDMGKFRAALDGKKFAAKVQADSQAGSGFGANGTPTFFINGRQLVGAQPFPSFKAMIDEEIGKADKLLASGVKKDQLYEKLLANAETAAVRPIAPAAPAAAPVVTNIQLSQAPVKGPKNAPVTIVAFSDFECPYCSRVLPTLSQLEQDYKGKIKVAFKHQPLPFHDNAKLAAAASMAANEQGKFWEYHDKLFQNQRALDRASLERYGEELKLDMGKFRKVLDSNKYDELIAADSAEGMRIGAQGTPTFFINGRTLVGAQPVEQFKQIIDEELAKAGKK